MNDTNNQNQQDNDNANVESVINENNNQDNKVLDDTEMPSNPPATPQDKSKDDVVVKVSKTPLILSLLSIAIAVGVGFGGYFMAQQQTRTEMALLKATFDERETKLKEEILAVKSQLEAANQNSIDGQNSVLEIKNALQRQIANFESQQASNMRNWDIKQQTFSTQLIALEDKVNRLASQDNTSWLISQADFYVKMAARRLWTERDVLTAMTLLKTADSSLAEMNDSSLINARSAIANDIAVLAAINPPDIDGVVARLTALTNAVDGLKLKPEFRWVTPESNATETTTDSISDWRENLSANLRNFTSDFISIRRIDGELEPILAPEQVTYLRENIRARILLSAQAVSRRQDAVYQQTLTDVLTAINHYFDINDPATIHIVSELNELKQQPLSLTLPEKFESAELINRLVQERVLKWINEPKVNQLEAKQATEVQSNNQTQPLNSAQPNQLQQ